MKRDDQPAMPVFLPDWVWELVGVHITVALGCYLMWFFAVGPVELQVALGLGAWLLGLHLSAGRQLRLPCPFSL